MEILIQIELLSRMSNRMLALRRLCKIYRDSPSDKRKSIRNMWPFGQDWPHIPIKYISQSSSEVEPAVDRIYLALTYLSISFDVYYRGYSRDALCYLVAIYHSCLMNEVSSEDLMMYFHDISSEGLKTVILSVLELTEEERSLENFGLKLNRDHQGYFIDIA